MKSNGYKFTDAEGKTRSGLPCEMQWGESVTNRVEWRGVLCKKGVLHSYPDPLLAVFQDPVNGAYLSKPGALLWRIEGSGQYTTDGLKDGWEQITTIETIPIPAMTVEQRVEIAIRRSLQVYSEGSYVTWAENWLSGKNRSAAFAAEYVPLVAWYAACSVEKSAAESAKYTKLGDAPEQKLLEIIHQVMAAQAEGG